MKYLFEENQKFTQWWLWVILLSFPIMSFGPFDENEININYVLIGFILPLIFYLFELRIKVSNKGLHYQFFPFHFSTKTLLWSEIELAEIRTYDPIGEYGGWGLRYSFNKKKGNAVNVSGDIGIQLTLTSGKKLLIGTQKKEAVTSILKTYKLKQS